MGSLHRRIKNLEATSTPPEPPEEIVRKMMQRLDMVIWDELGRVRAPHFIPGQKDPKDRVGPSLVVQRYGAAYTYGQHHELAIRRVIEERGLDEVMKPKFEGTDFRPYIKDEDRTPEGRERLVQMFIEFHKERVEELGASWDEVNKWARQDHEKAVREEWEV
jgi:hypothetical protein